MFRSIEIERFHNGQSLIYFSIFRSESGCWITRVVELLMDHFNSKKAAMAYCLNSSALSITLTSSWKAVSFCQSMNLYSILRRKVFRIIVTSFAMHDIYLRFFLHYLYFNWIIHNSIKFYFYIIKWIWRSFNSLKVSIPYFSSILV